MIRQTVSAVLAGAFLFATVTASIAQPENGEFGRLVDGKGAEETYYACTGCHSDMLIVQQGLSRDRWDALIEWMIDEQGMAELETDERELILDYLATNYGPDRPNFPTK